jgi:hypothetical protein
MVSIQRKAYIGMSVVSPTESNPVLWRLAMSTTRDMFEEDFIYSMTIRLKNGKVIRRANGKPFRFRAKRT